MRVSVIFSVALVSVLLGLAGCEDKGGEKASGGGGGGEIGVAECDEYVTKYKACLSDKVPAEAKDAMEKGMQTMVDGWKKAAATPEGKKGLAAGCKQALEGAKTAMASYGCEW